jgi:hypothetical protein
MRQQDDTYAEALRRALARPENIAAMDQAQAFARDFLQALYDVVKEFELRRVQNDVWFEEAVDIPYRQAGSPYGDGSVAEGRWFREQLQQHRQSGE